MPGMNEYTPELFELVDENGNKINFELIDIAELNGELYYAMIPAVEDKNYLNMDCELVILKSVYEENEEVLDYINDDKEFMEISKIFYQRMEEKMDAYDRDDI